MSPATLDDSDWTGLLADTVTPVSCEMCHRHVTELPTYADRR